MRMRDPKLLCAAILSSLLLITPAKSLAGPAESDGGSSRRSTESEWQILTKRNFSSEIRRHPHLLLMVTLPWYGESRSLMKEVSQLVADKQEEFGYLTVRVVFRNFEKMLADVLGASEGMALFYYHHSTSYKYQGRLRAQNILSSVYHFMSLQIEEVPLKHLHTQDDLENFIQSTDKSVLLLEFCGWSAKLLHKKNNENNETLLSIADRSDNAGVLGEELTKEADATLAFENKKDLENEELTCGVETEFAGSPWLAGFTWANQSASQATENRSAATGMSCTLEEFQQFESFFLKFTTIAREYYLPLERQRFGLISERSLLPFLGVDNPKTWLLLLQFSGCINCSIVLQEGDDLRTFLQMHNSLVMELDVDGHSLEPAFPANRPSIILFVDRSSNSSKVRGESKSSLQALRKFAQHNQLSYQIIRGQDGSNSESSSSSSRAWSRSTSNLADHRPPNDFLASNALKIKDKVAIMIINKGESILLEHTDTQHNHAYDILTHRLHQNNPAFKTKETKVSLLAKEVGFELLSNDFEVQVIDSLPSDKENSQFDEMASSAVVGPEDQTSEFPQESTEHSSNMNNDDLLNAMDISTGNGVKQPELADLETIVQQNKETVLYEGNTCKFAPKLVKEVKDEIGVSNCTQADEDNESCRQEESEPYTCPAENSFHMEESPIVKEYIEQEHVDHTYCSSSKTCTDGIPQNLTHAVPSIDSVGDDAAGVKKTIITSKLADQHAQLPSFLGSIFFSDGGYQLLRALTAGLKIPSVVILDPVMLQHYVFSDGTNISYSALVNFVDKFLNGSLTPYQQSASPIISSRETSRPPFVNLDFHEADSIPRVTANTFCELVVGFKHCEMGTELLPFNIQNFTSAWKMDVLVFFSTSWCGFCQRMELIVREVYRAFKSFMNMKSQPKNMDPLHIQDKTEETMMNKLPSIFLMDCTLNYCGSFLGKKEVYPALLLFPAENKSTISYEADVSVVNIIEFLVSRGSNSQYLSSHKGSLSSQASKGSESRTSFRIDERDPFAEDYKYDEFPLGTEIGEDNHHHVGSHTSSGFHYDVQQVAVGSFLVATDKLLGAFPFDRSNVLIVMADRNEGFQGMILNKRMSWDIFKEIEDELEPLKRAPLFYGGPERGDGYPLVSLACIPVDWYSKIRDGLYYGDPVATHIAVDLIKSGEGEGSIDDYWFFLGYSSWEWAQLSDELAAGAWQLSSSPEEDFEWPDDY